MTATLSPQVSSEFADSADFDKFFGRRDSDTIRNELEIREQPMVAVPGSSCKTNLFFGFFFDGTKNNYVQAESGRNHSNVARLYDCYPGLSIPGVLPKSTDWQYNPSRYTHFFKVYVPGVSSPFAKVNDTGKGVDGTAGGASGALGERRIIWALVQAINNVHRYFLKTPLVLQEEMDNLLKRIYLNKRSRSLMESRNALFDPALNRGDDVAARREFGGILSRLHSAVSGHLPSEKTGKPAKIDPGIVKTIYVSTFGFSRGATEARAFANWFQSLCKLDALLRGKPGMSLGGFDVQFDFLGLFDTVASVGLANTFGGFNGHAAWADTEDSLRVPLGVKCLHLVAAHELRRSFPVDSISVRGVVPEGCEEIVVPGVHSDVGSGYCPCEQGRGSDPNGDDMLTRIPLLMMYKAARLNGAPLKLELAAPAARAKFALKAETIKAFNAYIADCKETRGPIHQIMREQARKQIEWRSYRRITGKNPLQKSASFQCASTFDQNDLYSAAEEFEQEVSEFEKWLSERGRGFHPASQKAGFDNERSSEWEEIARWWQKNPTPSADVVRFFDDYVHDSRAWFKCNGSPDNEAEMIALLEKWKRMRSQAMPVLTGKADYRMPSALSDDQTRAADEYARTGKIPRMRTSGREPSTLAGAGYLRFRKIYGGWDSELISSVSASDDEGVVRA